MWLLLAPSRSEEDLGLAEELRREHTGFQVTHPREKTAPIAHPKTKKEQKTTILVTYVESDR
jgi:hypothetical protein